MLIKNFKGLTIVVENPVGSIREGIDRNGEAWQTKFLYDYGYVYGTKGADKEGVDVFIGNDISSGRVFIIHQHEGHGIYDEDKVMIGFNSLEQARDAYLAHYNTQGYLGNISEMPFFEFKDKVMKPFSTLDAKKTPSAKWVTLKKEGSQSKGARKVLIQGGRIVGGDVPKKVQGKKLSALAKLNDKKKMQEKTLKQKEKGLEKIQAQKKEAKKNINKLDKSMKVNKAKQQSKKPKEKKESGKNSLQEEFKQKHPAVSGVEVHSANHSQKEAIQLAKSLRDKGVFASIFHQSGPKAGDKSKYFVTIPKSKEQEVKPIAINQAKLKVLKEKLKSPDLGMNKTPIQRRGHVDKVLSAKPSKREALAIGDIVSTAKVSPQIAKQMYDQVQYYTDGGFQEMRENPNSPQAKLIENLIEKSPKWDSNIAPLTRGVSLSPKAFSKLVKGKEIKMNGLSSWTSNPHIAEKFTKYGYSGAIAEYKPSEEIAKYRPVIFRLSHSNKATSIAHLSEAQTNEQEILLSSKSKLVVQSIKRLGKYHIIKLKEIVSKDKAIDTFNGNQDLPKVKIGKAKSLIERWKLDSKMITIGDK